jgi:hypothetical protein
VKSKLFKILLAVVLSLIIAVGALLGRQTSVFVCRHCGVSASESEWQIPFTSFTVFHESRHIVPSPLSTTLVSLAIVDTASPHDWILAHGVGNGVMCGLGVGGSAWACSRSERVAELVRAAHASGDSALRDQLIHCIFERDTAPVVHTLAESAPANAFSDASAFAAWRAEKAKLMHKLLHVDPPNHAMQRTAPRTDAYPSSS